MNNQKGNQLNTAVNDQNLSNKNIDSLKEFNSTPIDTPTPVSLSENLETSNSLTEESLPVEESKPQVPPESQTEPLLDPEVELKPAPEINPEPQNEFDQENEVIPLSEVEPQPKPNFESNSESEIQPQSEVKVELNPEPKIEPPPPTIQTETKPSTPVSQDPEAIKQKIEEVLSYNTASNIADSQLNKPKTSRFLITLFILSLIIFLAIVGSLAYFLANPISKTNSETKVTPTNTPVQSNITCELNGFVYSLNQSFPSADGCNTCTCVSADNIKCTDNPCSSDTTTPATSSSTSSTKTSFQKMVVNLSLYKDISNEERDIRFSGTTGSGDYWPSWVKSTDKLYSFSQKLIKGSIKKLTIDKNNFKSLLSDLDYYDYTFYLTPNYEKWTDKDFKKLDYEAGGIGDLTPLYAYPDKLIWTTRTSCGGVGPDSESEKAALNQCESLIKEAQTAFL